MRVGAAVFFVCLGLLAVPARAAKVNAHDVHLMAQANQSIVAWNKHFHTWSVAYKSGKRARFLSVYQRETDAMQKAAYGIRFAVIGLQNQRLHTDMVKLANIYLDELDGVIDVNSSVIQSDLKAGQRALDRIRQIFRRKVTLLDGFAKRFPQFAEGLT